MYPGGEKDTSVPMYPQPVLEFAILGFLFEARLHGYDLRTRLAALTGHVRPIADSTLYPAIKRLVEGDLVIKNKEPGPIAAPRQMLELTPAGRTKLLGLLREPPDTFITDENQWFCLLAFLRHLDDPFRRGVLQIARVTSRTEIEWLRTTVGALEAQSGHSAVGN